MKSKIKSYNVYLPIAGIFFVISFFSFLLVPNRLLNISAVDDLNKLYSDFLIHVIFSSDLSTVYDSSIHACFPPLIYLFYHSISLMLPAKEIMADSHYNAYYNYCGIYMVLVFITLTMVCKRYLSKASDKVTYAFIFLLVLSSSFTFGVIQCANISVLPLILLLIAVEFKDSNSKVKQEIALILIAISAAIKIYPAVFGLAYLLEKKTSQALRLIVYGMLFFFVPFAFTGGIHGIEQFISNSASVQGTWGNISPNGIYSNVYVLTNNMTIATASNIAISCIVVLLLFFIKDNWKKYFCFSFLMVMFPMWSGAYTPTFFLIPFLYYIKNHEFVENKLDFVYLALFSLIFTCSCFNFTVSSVKTFVLAMAILLVMICELVAGVNKNKMSKR